jgi:hypothetical protein
MMLKRQLTSSGVSIVTNISGQLVQIVLQKLGFQYSIPVVKYGS